MNESKIPLSLRVHPDLKAEIENEAYESGLTTSKYMENILLQRQLQPDTTVDELNSGWEQLYNDLETEKRTLEKEQEEFEEAIIRLARENRELKSELDEQTERLEALRSETASVSKENLPTYNLSFSPEEEAAFSSLVDRLCSAYPNLSKQQLLLACLRTTLKNERSYFFIHQLGANAE